MTVAGRGGARRDAAGIHGWKKKPMNHPGASALIVGVFLLAVSTT